MVAPTYYTAEMLRAFPDDGNRYETVHGELLVTPSPPAGHQDVVSRVVGRLNAYLERSGAGIVLTPPADISWDRDVLVQPDVFVVPLDEARTLRWSSIRSVLLAVEVSTHSTSRFDRFTKRRLYQEVGVPLYWILDPERRHVEVWTPRDTLPRVVRDQVAWHPTGAYQPFHLAVDQVLRPQSSRRLSKNCASARRSN